MVRIKKVKVPKGGFKSHSAADLFPMMDDREFKELKMSMLRHGGLRESIKVVDDLIVDGRNRYKALQELAENDDYHGYGPSDACNFEDISMRFSFTGEESTITPTDYVLALNLHRRHLNESQRALVAANLKQHLKMIADNPNCPAAKLYGWHPELIEQENSTEKSGKQKRDIIGEKLNVSGYSVTQAEKVIRHAEPELLDAVRQGKVAVSSAASIAKEPSEVQRQAAAMGKLGVAQAAKQVRKRKQQKQLSIEQRLRDLTSAIEMQLTEWPIGNIDEAIKRLEEIAARVRRGCEIRQSMDKRRQNS